MAKAKYYEGGVGRSGSYGTGKTAKKLDSNVYLQVYKAKHVDSLVKLRAASRAAATSEKPAPRSFLVM